MADPTSALPVSLPSRERGLNGLPGLDGERGTPGLPGGSGQPGYPGQKGTYFIFIIRRQYGSDLILQANPDWTACQVRPARKANRVSVPLDDLVTKEMLACLVCLVGLYV